MTASIVRAEIAIIGAGLIGSALAQELGRLGVASVVVLDPDLEGVRSSSELNAGGVRATFAQDLNILASKITIEYFEKHAQEVGYRPVGYLWMHDAAGMERALRARDKWTAHGWETQVWDVARLREYAPFIDQTDDLAGALFGPRDGLVNPNLLKLHFRANAKTTGARFLDGHRVRAATVVPGQTVRLECEVRARDGSVSSAIVEADRVVNCAGAWAAEVARLLGYDSPVYPIRRQISMFDCREVDLSNYGMMIDSSGVYFHPEGGSILSGIAERDEPRGMNFEYGGEAWFQEKIWYPLSERSSKFAALRHTTGWGGLYEVSPDESAVIGEVEAGAARGTGKIFESHSYSGHGVMHSYAAGVALAEKMVRGSYHTLDLSPLSGRRFETGQLVLETAVI